MLCERGRSPWAGAIGAAVCALAIAGGSACAGGLDDPQRFQDSNTPVTSGPSTTAGVGGGTQMLPLLPMTEGVDPLLPMAPLGSDAGVTVPGSGGSGGIGGTGGGSVPIAPDAPWPPPPPACVVDVLTNRCSGLECHGPGTAEVDLISPGVAARLVDQPSSPNLLCAGRTLVATDGSPSLLLDKLRDATPCGSRMPTKGNLGAQSTDCLVAWVASLQRPSDFDAGAP
jgi:hypothetical protein